MSKFKTIIGGIGTLVMVCGGVVGTMVQPVGAATNLGPAAEDQFVDDPVTIVRINPNWNTVAIEYNGTGDFLGNRMALINIMWEDPYDIGRLDEFGELRDQQPDWANPYMYFKVPTWSMMGTPEMTWQFDGPGEVKGELFENKMMKLYYSIGAMVGTEMMYQSGVIDYSTCARSDGSIPEGVECRAVKQKDGNVVYEPFFLDGEKPEWAALETGSYNPEEVYAEEIEEGKIAREEAERLEREEQERLEREAQEEQERLEREERERLEQEERERIEQEEQERLEREERERIEREEQERLEREKQIEDEGQLQEEENERSVNTEVTKEVTKIEEYKTVIEVVKNEGDEQKIAQEAQEEQGNEQEVKNDGEENKQISNEIVEVPELGGVEDGEASDWTGIVVAVLTGAVVGAGGFWLVLHLLWKKKQEDEE